MSSGNRCATRAGSAGRTACRLFAGRWCRSPADRRVRRPSPCRGDGAPGRHVPRGRAGRCRTSCVDRWAPAAACAASPVAPTRDSAAAASSAAVMTNRRQLWATSLSVAPSGNPPARSVTVIDRRSIVGLRQVHGRRQRAQGDGGQVGLVGEALDELQGRDANDVPGGGTRRLVHGESLVGLQDTLDDAGDGVLDPQAAVGANAHQRARHTDFDQISAEPGAPADRDTRGCTDRPAPDERST